MAREAFGVASMRPIARESRWPMTQADWDFKTAAELVAALTARKVSALELTEQAIARIEREDPDINAICVRDFDRALSAARAADEALGRGERRPLLGVPMTIKESFNIAGLPTTWGMAAFKDFRPAQDAVAVARVKAAGAVLLGKTNVPFALADWQSYNDLYGTTRNPWDLGRTPGGSSGGSAAAVAAGFGALSLGSDIGGSLRAPAHYCGIFAHKPTFALLPSRGHTPPSVPALPHERDLAVIGPMARGAGDLALLLDVLAGPDEQSLAVAYRLALPPARHQELKRFRVLVLEQHPLLPTAASVSTAIDALADRLAKAGASVARDSPLLPDLADSARLYMRLLFAFLAAFWPAESYARMRSEADALPPAGTSLGAERTRGAVLSHREWVLADGARARLSWQWRQLFDAFDVVVCPVMPTPAYPHDHSPDQRERHIVVDGTPYPYMDQLVWPGVATTPGLPATAVPIGVSKEGLPIGVQIVGPAFEDRTPLVFAALLERTFGGFVPPPPFT
jgi:amidase